MALTIDNTNEIITMTEADDEVEGIFSVFGILFCGTSAGAAEVTDGVGSALAVFVGTDEIPTGYIPINRTVSGLILKSTTVDSVMIYMKKGV